MGWLRGLICGTPQARREPPPIRCMDIIMIRDKRVTGQLSCTHQFGHAGEHYQNGIRWR